jgi:coenzyme PQQ precursor peptide PqqA
LHRAGTAITLDRNGPRRVTNGSKEVRGHAMAWTTPTLVEICIGLEINGYLPAEF